METIYSCQQDRVKTFGNTHRGLGTKQGLKKTKQRTNTTVIFIPIHFIHLEHHLSVQISIKPNCFDKQAVLFHGSNNRLVMLAHMAPGGHPVTSIWVTYMTSPFI